MQLWKTIIITNLELPIEAIRIIHTGLSQAVEKWSGGPAEEQEDLINYER